MMKNFIVLLCLFSAFATTVSAQSKEEIFEFTRQPAVSGNEKQLLQTIKARLPNWAEARFDNLGNLVVTAGRGSPARLFVAPVDEFGYVVSEIRADGFIRVQLVQLVPPTPLFHQFHEGQPIFIVTEKGNVPGVTATLSTHLQRSRADNSDTRIAQPDDLWIDIGARSREEVEAAGVRLLDPISLRERAVKLGQYQVAGVGASARAAVVALLSLLADTSPDSVDGTLTVAFVTQETFGRRGIDRLARELHADEAVVITDAWFGTSAPPGQSVERDSLGRVGKLGNGPLVVASDDYWGESANLQRIPALRARNSIYTGGPAFGETKVHLVALPVMFAGTTVETVDSRDAKELGRLLSAKVNKRSAQPGSVGTVKEEAIAREQDSTLGILVEAYGVSGFEKPVAETIKKLLPSWAKPEMDERGNMILTVGQGKHHLVFAAHMDEIGYVISAINEDGTASVEKRGGFYDTLFEAHPMLVHSARGQVPCVLSPRRDYSRAERRSVPPQEIFLYFGTTSRAETEALGIKAGDSVTMPKRFELLRQGRASGRSFDDRVGVASLVMALQKIDPARLKNRVTFVWTIEEEIGLNGAKVVADRMRADADLLFAVDTFVSSDSPLESSRFAHALLGRGAVVRAMDNSNIVPREMLDKILKLARERNIPVQYGVTGGGNDGAVFTQYGAINTPLSWPLRYSHSPAEVIDLRDLDALADLVRAIAEHFEP